MIVDDAAQCRDPLVTLFQKLGHTALPASNGIEALRMLERKSPDMILLDIKMPEMDGITFLRTMRSRTLWKDIPVVVLTGLTDKRTVMSAAELGVKDFLLKAQFGVADLMTRLEKQLGHSPTSNGTRQIDVANENYAAPDDADELAGYFEPPPTRA